MKVSELREFLTELKTLKQKNSNAVDNFCDVCGEGAFETPIVETGWKFLDLSVKMASKYFNIELEDLDWFIYEDEFGDNAYEITDDYTIDSIDSFIDYIVGELSK